MPYGSAILGRPRLIYRIQYPSQCLASSDENNQDVSATYSEYLEAGQLYPIQHTFIHNDAGMSHLWIKVKAPGEEEFVYYGTDNHTLYTSSANHIDLDQLTNSDGVTFSSQDNAVLPGLQVTAYDALANFAEYDPDATSNAWSLGRDSVGPVFVNMNSTNDLASLPSQGLQTLSWTTQADQIGKTLVYTGYGSPQQHGTALMQIAHGDQADTRLWIGDAQESVEILHARLAYTHMQGPTTIQELLLLLHNQPKPILFFRKIAQRTPVPFIVYTNVEAADQNVNLSYTYDYSINQNNAIIDADWQMIDSQVLSHSRQDYTGETPIIMGSIAEDDIIFTDLQFENSTTYNGIQTVTGNYGTLSYDTSTGIYLYEFTSADTPDWIANGGWFVGQMVSDVSITA